MELVSLSLSAFASILSAYTAWTMLFWRNRLQMTKPPFIAFVRERGEAKVFFRTFLFATLWPGHVVERIYIKLVHRESAQTFDNWEYCENDVLSAGTGIRVGEEGVVYTYHFRPSKGKNAFQFLPGDYRIGVYATLARRRRPVLLSELRMALSPGQATAMEDKGATIYFDWSPVLQAYLPRIDV